MSKHLFRVAADIPRDIRQSLLAQFKPIFSTVFVRTVTLAYGVTADYEVPEEWCEFAVHARHLGLDHEALLVSVNGEKLRPDGRLFHITLSTENLPPVEAGNISPSGIVSCGKASFEAHFRAFPLAQGKFVRGTVTA